MRRKMSKKECEYWANLPEEKQPFKIIRNSSGPNYTEEEINKRLDELFSPKNPDYKYMKRVFRKLEKM